ncbi:MAG TPA: c-type cytochrome [Terriglobales bacterium]|jgi:hypothetical protein|nr:c-type cytochrome [Terriglobales bacterium]
MKNRSFVLFAVGAVVLSITTLWAESGSETKVAQAAPAKTQAQGAAAPAKPTGAPTAGAAAAPSAPASPAEIVARGAKVARLCDSCHTLRDEDQEPVVGEFGGGKQLLPDTFSANITNGPQGINYFTEDMLHTALRESHVGARKLKVMTPALFKRLTDDDIHAVWMYLRQVKPVNHRVDNTEEPTMCKKCRQKHGAGDLN